MSIDKSLRRKNSLARVRSVLKRDERIKILMEDGRFKEGQSPFGLPKVRVKKIVIKKAKKEKTDQAAASGKSGKK
jgi:small basic protein (TIGR04137 family)